MKRGFVLIIAISIIFMSLISLIGAPLAAGSKERIKQDFKSATSLLFLNPTTCSMIWGGNCSEGPPESFKNTFDSCSTGFGGDESINEIYLNQSYLLFGSQIEIICNVMIWGIMNMSDAGCGWGWNGDRLGIYYRNSSTAEWVRKAHFSQVYSCENYSVSFVPDLVEGEHQIRCNTGYKISPNAACASGDYYDNDDVSFSYYAPFISITLSNAPIDFGDNANPGSTTDAINNPLIVEVDSNINFDITTKADDAEFTSGTGTDSFPVSNMKWQTSPSSPLTSYSTTEELVYSNERAGDFNIYHKLSVPPAQAPGTYTADVIITAKATGM
jgi:hypothetical protein